MDQETIGNLIVLFFSISIPVAMLVGTYLIGGAIERSHLRRLAQEEQSFSDILLSDLRSLPPNWDASDAMLVAGEAVIATDYFKVFVAGLMNLFGGRIRGLETLMERARRQATVRMLQQARRLGANCVWCVRIETSTIAGKEQANKSGGVEVIAYGTAMRVRGKQ